MGNTWSRFNDTYVLTDPNGKIIKTSPRHKPIHPGASALMKRTVADADKFFMAMGISPNHEQDALVVIADNLVKHNKTLTAEYVQARNQSLMKYMDRYKSPARDYPAYAKAVFNSPDFAVLMAKDLGTAKNVRSTGIAPMKASTMNALMRHFVRENGGLPTVIQQIKSEKWGTWIHPEQAAMNAVRSKSPIEIVKLLANLELLAPATVATLDLKDHRTRTLLVDIYVALAMLVYVRIFDKYIKRRP